VLVVIAHGTVRPVQLQRRLASDLTVAVKFGLICAIPDSEEGDKVGHRILVKARREVLGDHVD